ncbi:MAG: FdtA/QdtA family cupin domain-containing protein [Betaproteobacteria bacterium]|nr:FdtA/QdtA family cupin domain-containing protein [Betaproteobacteria bacterium]
MRPHLLDVELHRDARGGLISLQSGTTAPFSLQRVFFIFDVPPEESRGGHVTTCQELVIALQGSCQAATVQAGVEQDFQLTSPTQALYVPAGVWLKLHRFSPGALLAVAADGPYVPR